MRCIWMVSGLVLALLGSQAIVAETAVPAAVVEDKAEVLEQKRRQGPDTQAQAITPGEVQVVDPAGKAPLDGCHHLPVPHDLLGGERYLHGGHGSGGQRGDEPPGPCRFSRYRVWRGQAGGVETRALASFPGGVTGARIRSGRRATTPKPKEIARKALNQQLKDRTLGALYFHDRNVKPDWSRTYIKTADTSVSFCSITA